MRNCAILLITVTWAMMLLSPAAGASLNGTAGIPDPWVYHCGDGSGPDCPGMTGLDSGPADDIPLHMVEEAAKSARAGNRSGYIVAGRPLFSGNERAGRHLFSVSSSGFTESYTEITDRTGRPCRTNTSPDCRGFLSGDSPGTRQMLPEALRSPDPVFGQRGELRAKDTIARDYPGIARVCLENSVYWDNQTTDGKHDYFFVDSQAIVVPYAATEQAGGIKNREVTFSFDASRERPGVAPLSNSWLLDPGPKTAPLAVLENPAEPSGPAQGYGYAWSPFDAAVTLSSENPGQYGWHVATGFFSRYAELPFSIDPHVGIVTGRMEARNASPHRLLSAEFNGTRGWCTIRDWKYEELPQTPSAFGSDYVIRWTGTGA